MHPLVAPIMVVLANILCSIPRTALIANNLSSSIINLLSSSINNNLSSRAGGWRPPRNKYNATL
jgi:hypothetical protein